jgi:nucleotide-binding universal stress UspA family protein
MSTVLVAVDGSEKDQRAMAAAAAFARLVDGDLHLVRVIGPPPLENLPPRAYTMGVAESLLEIRRDALGRLEAIAGQLVAATGRPVTMEIVDSADIGGEILARASERNVDAIVMATRAAGAVGRTVRGSVADQVMRESPRPVVLVPPRADELGERELQLRRVLIPLDGSSLAAAATDTLSRLEVAHRLEYVLLEVVTPGFVSVPTGPPAPAWPAGLPIPDPRGLPDLAQACGDAEKRLRTAAADLRSHGAADVETRVLTADDPAAAVSSAAGEERADFIAMTTRGSSGLKRFVLGSVAERVVRTSTVPVLLITPRSFGAA